MKNKLMQIKKQKELSNFELGLDIGVSEFTVFSILHDTKMKHLKSTVCKIERYLSKCGGYYDTRDK